MKIAIISDIHGNLPALRAVLADIARQCVDQTVNLGDSLSGPLQPAETADLLMAQGFPTIKGNHERQLLAARAAHRAGRSIRQRWLRGRAGIPGTAGLARRLAHAVCFE